jgi:hypothetical protein
MSRPCLAVTTIFTRSPYLLPQGIRMSIVLEPRV